MLKKHGFIVLLMGLAVSGCQCGKEKNNTPAGKDSTLSAADIQLRNINIQIKKDSSKPESYFIKGNLLMGMDSFKRAYLAYARAIKLDSHDIKYYKAIADAAIQWGNLKAAINPLKTAIKHEPKSDLKVKLAETYMYLRQYDEAKNVLDDVLSNDRDNDHALVIKGVIQKETGDTAGALKSFQLAGQANSKNTEAFMQIAALQAKRHNLIALQYFDNAIKSDSNYAEAYMAKATFYESLKRDAEAKKTYKKLITRDPFDEDALFNLAFLYMREDSIVKAYKYFDLCINTKHEDADAWYYRGICSSLLGKKSDAINDWKQAIILKPDFALAKEALAKEGIK